MIEHFTPTEYSLMNVATGRIFKDGGWMLADPESPKPSLVRAVYQNKQLHLRDESYGFYKFADWLPINKTLKCSAPTITYRSEKLSLHLGMENLYISFSGYWPEKGAFMRTCSFKETEAYSVCGRLLKGDKRILTVASAGNTARAFAQVCSDNDIPLLLCVPEDNINALWFKEPLNECVRLICPPKGSDYFDAIALSQIVCASENFMDEGGAKNVARRDGMGTVVLSAATHIGRIPDAYFQAIGSGTGAIAAWEANMRLLEDGRYGNTKMRLYTTQNAPFTPMYDAFKADSRDLFPMDEDQARTKALAICAKVLSNRKPPYSLCGGVYDALKDTGGDIEIAENGEITTAIEMFKELEGIDIHSAAAAALVGMKKTLESGKIKKEDLVMLNITGGGEAHLKSQHKVCYLNPSLIISPKEDKELIIKKVESLFR